MEKQFVVIVIHPLTATEAFGMFPHEEDAQAWAREKYKHTLVAWRAVAVTPKEAA
jgi:hypothetical protein